MGGNADDQYAPASNELNPGGSWGAAPPIMHSWCLQSNEPASGIVQTESRGSKFLLANVADDDSGFDLNLGLSLGGKSNKAKVRKKAKEALLDRDSFRADTGERRHDVVSKDENGEESCRDFIMFKAGQDEANPNPNRVQHAFWQDLDPAGSEAPEMTGATLFSPHQVQGLIPNQQAVEPSRWAAENSVAEDSKFFSRHMPQALQGTVAEPEHQRIPLSAQDEASIFATELQGLPPEALATAAAWARIVATGSFPMQILDVIKDEVDPGMSGEMALQRWMSTSTSHSSGPHLEVISAASPPTSQQTAVQNADLERSDTDVSKKKQIVEEKHRQVTLIQQQEFGEQRRKRELQTQKRQEARRKRKALLEEQKSKKPSKKEEDWPGAGGAGGGQGSRSDLDTPPSSLKRTSSLQPSSAMRKESSVTIGLPPPDSQDAGGAPSISAFRGPGSTSWLHNWDGNKPQTAGMDAVPVKVNLGTNAKVNSVEQTVEIWRALERARDRGTKDTGEDSGGLVESNSDVCKVSSPVVAQMQRMDSNAGGAIQVVKGQEGSNLESPTIDPTWIQKIIEMQIMMPNVALMQRQGQIGADMAAPVAGLKIVAKKGRASSQTSSSGTESSSEQDGKSANGVRVVHGDADAASFPAVDSAGTESRPNPPYPLTHSVCNSMAMANMTFPQGGAFPMISGAFPIPLPLPPGVSLGRVSFGVPFPFPYLMQVTPNSATASDGNSEQRADPSMPSPFQIPLSAGFNPPFHMQTPEGAAPWPSTAVRPHATPPQSPPLCAAAKLSQSGLSRDDIKHGPRGANGKEHARSRNLCHAGNLPAQSLVKTNSMGSGAFNRLHTTGEPANSSPLAPQFGIPRSKSDAVASGREGSVESAFAPAVEQQPIPPSCNEQANSLTESEPKCSTGVGSVPRNEPANSCGAAASGEDGGISASGAPGNSHQPEVAAAQSTSTAGGGARRHHPSGVWRPGSLPSFEGIAGQEASSLRPGVAPGLHFGGTGTPPDLPWVTCNGTISGVLYRVEKGLVRIVCACHGRHMTPAEFVQHAGCGEILNPEKAIVVGPFNAMSQQAASAQA